MPDGNLSAETENKTHAKGFVQILLLAVRNLFRSSDLILEEYYEKCAAEFAKATDPTMLPDVARKRLTEKLETQLVEQGVSRSQHDQMIVSWTRIIALWLTTWIVAFPAIVGVSAALYFPHNPRYRIVHVLITCILLYFPLSLVGLTLQSFLAPWFSTLVNRILAGKRLTTRT